MREIRSIVGAAAGSYFGILSAFSIRAVALPRHVPRMYSVAFAVVAALLACLAFRAALLGKTDEDSVVSALRNGIVGALIAVVVVIALYVMFGFAIHAFFAHLVGLYAWQVTMFRLLIAFVCLGFGAGFVLRMQKLRETGAVPRSSDVS